MPFGSELNSKVSEDTGWLDLNYYVHYRKIQNIVYVRINNGNALTISNSGYDFGTLPDGFRPSDQMDFAGTPIAGTNEVSFRVARSGIVTGFSNPSSVYWNGAFCYPV